MSLQLSDPVSGTTLPLWQASELRSERSAALDVSPITGQESTQAFLTALEQDGRATISGTVTAQRLARDTTYGFSSDPVTALAEWAVRFEAFVNGGQGDGYDLDRQYRNDTFTGVVETAEWTRAGGAPRELGWNLSFIRGAGAGVDNDLVEPSVSPGGDITLDGVTLPNVREFQVEKSQSFEVYRRAFAETAEDNDLFSDAGATRRITIVGSNVGDAATRNTFDDNVTASLGQDELVTLRDALTGRTFEGMIGSYDATDESGRTRLGDYAVEFVVGTE
mgnify:CR=1 FL=1